MVSDFSLCDALSRLENLKKQSQDFVLKAMNKAASSGRTLKMLSMNGVWLFLVSETNFYLSLCNWKGLCVFKSNLLSFSRLLKGGIELSLITGI